MRAWLAPLAVLIISGCTKPEVEACEKFIKSNLTSPSSFERVSLTEGTEPISQEDLEELRPRSNMDRIRGGERALRLVSIEYDADNAYGARIRGGEVCAFEMRNGELDEADVIASDGRQSESKARMRRFADQGMVDVPPESLPSIGRYPCCLN